MPTVDEMKEAVWPHLTTLMDEEDTCTNVVGIDWDAPIAPYPDDDTNDSAGDFPDDVFTLRTLLEILRLNERRSHA